MTRAAPALEKTLPNNIEAERSVLGAILLDNGAIAGALKHVSSGDFFYPHHKKIFACMLRLTETTQPIDLVTLCEALFQGGELDSIPGGAGGISSLTDGMPKVSNVEHYAKIVRAKAQLRTIIHLTHNLQQNAFEGDADPDVISGKLRSAMTDSAPMKVVGGNGHLSYSLHEFLAAQFPPPDHLVEGVIPRGGTVLIVALPHRLKSWFTTALAIGCTRAGMVLGKLEVKKPVRTLLVQVEDFPGQLQWRIGELLKTQAFNDCESENVRIIPRCGLNLPDEAWYQNLLREVQNFKADHVIMDVVRRIFRGDINSPKDTAAFLEQVDRLREATDVTTTLVHHENKKDAEIMTAAAGSYNLPGWANVMIQFKRKTQEGHVVHVEIEVDNKLAQSPEPMRMVLDLSSELPLRIEPLEDGVGISEAMDRLGPEWTVRDLAEALEVHKSNAQRRLKKWMAMGKAEKIVGGKRGRAGGLARYCFTQM
jgi:KaiC/GvpD/RAD55 family RecA-like ATPase